MNQESANTKTIIITGANSGIGMAAAKLFAARGYQVVMACRNIEKSRKAQREIIEASGNTEVDLMQLDVSSFESVEDFVEEYETKYQVLDILINNAGYFNYGEKQYQFSDDGIEMSFATNAFGPLLLTNLLKPLLAKSADPRVLNANTTNIKYFFDPKRRIEWDNIRGEMQESKPYNAYKMYGDSKMAFLMLSLRQAKEFDADGIKINSVLIPAIKISKEKIRVFKTLSWRTMARLMNLAARPQEDMAECYFDICTSPEFQHTNGKLINISRNIMQIPEPGIQLSSLATFRQLRRMTMVPPYAAVPENADRIWKLALKLFENRN